MKFTDEDLKRLKKHHNWKPREKYIEDEIYIALFNRLQAAEYALGFMQVNPKSFKPAWAAFQAWHEACGK